MLLKTVYATARDRVRLRIIGRVLLNYGLQDLIRVLGLGALFRRLPATQAQTDSQPQRLRQALEALGPTFIKLGQILATRADLLDESWTRELEKLHSDVAQVPWETVRQQLIAALGDEPENVFHHFDPAPLGCASMAQVYRAQLHSGEEVVIKVLKPGQEKTIAADLRLLAWLAEFIEQQSPALAHFRPTQLIRQLTTALNQELDLRHEAANTQKVGENFRNRPDIRIPRIWPQYSSQTLLVQEYLPGTAPRDHRQLADAGFDGPELARRGALGFMQMVFTDRLYHADPHAGNLMALEGNRVAFIDFGMVGHLSISRRNQLLLMMQALSRRETEGLVGVLIKWNEDGVPDVSTLEMAAQDFLGRVGPGTLQLGHALLTMLTIARDYRLALPADLVLLFKALITADGVLRRIDPAFDIIGTLSPFLRRSVLQRHGLNASRQRAVRFGSELIEAGEELPQTLTLLLRRLQHGKLHADLDVKNLSELGRSLERSASLLAIAIVTAAFALGLAPWLLEQPLRVFGIPVFPLICLSIVTGGIIMLLWRLRR
ncbi:ABC1 kinase family protein [Enterobacillus tribolii]|uniref:Ubiquinone biosynthesis protein n=1 Tax=Enterobacillus tribolii TaxID=1487935 RepID=A0A370R366_9GAMM|nr:AarF/UbiB family protein [Enterobacillus tribolii]MBW7983924.1 AarF/ABC1/UbiB kinase family protein [Enterobacillus tribolii]RDK96861.1 ubiquinone biosynthesis protein [Enterobacillus tribolii]